MKIKNGELLDTFECFVNPEKPIPQKVVEVTNITDDMVKDAPYFEQISAALNVFIGNNLTIVGHNLPFDYRFITAVGDARPFIEKRKFFDTLEIARREYDFPKYTLDYLCKTVLKIVRNDSHSATSDALAAGFLFRDICNRRMNIE